MTVTLSVRLLMLRVVGHGAESGRRHHALERNNERSELEVLAAGAVDLLAVEHRLEVSGGRVGLERDRDPLVEEVRRSPGECRVNMHDLVIVGRP